MKKVKLMALTGVGMMMLAGCAEEKEEKEEKVELVRVETIEDVGEHALLYYVGKEVYRDVESYKELLESGDIENRGKYVHEYDVDKAERENRNLKLNILGEHSENKEVTKIISDFKLINKSLSALSSGIEEKQSEEKLVELMDEVQIVYEQSKKDMEKFLRGYEEKTSKTIEYNKDKSLMAWREFSSNDAVVLLTEYLYEFVYYGSLGQNVQTEGTSEIIREVVDGIVFQNKDDENSYIEYFVKILDELNIEGIVEKVKKGELTNDEKEKLVMIAEILRSDVPEYIGLDYMSGVKDKEKDDVLKEIYGEYLIYLYVDAFIKESVYYEN